MASLVARTARGLLRRAVPRCLDPAIVSRRQLYSADWDLCSSYLVSDRPHVRFVTPYHFVRSYCASERGESNPQSSSPGLHEENAESNSNSKKKTEDEREAPDEQRQVLEAALLHVPKLGWSEAALAAGAKDVGLSPAIMGAFPRKEAALVEFFMDDSLQTLIDYAESHEQELSQMLLQERLTKLIECRLQMQAPVISRWAQALSIQANPANLPTSFKQRAVLMDEIWHVAGDHSSDIDWYAKRGILAAVYAATELYMLTDHSPGFRDTWSFLQRRVKDALDCGKTAREASQLAQTIGAGLGHSLQGLFRR